MFFITKVNVLIKVILGYIATVTGPYRGSLPAYEKCRPLWLADEEKLSVEVVHDG